MAPRNPAPVEPSHPPRGRTRRDVATTHLEDGSDAGEATYSVMIRPGEEILVGKNEHLRVVAVVPFAEEDESPFVGLLQVEAA